MIVEPETRMRFAVRTTNALVDNAMVRFGYIVLIDCQTKAIITVTPYADYVLFRVPRDIQIGMNGEAALYAVVQFLNYIFIDNKDRYHISSISEVSKEMVSSFLSEYASNRISKKKVSKQSILNKRKYVSSFLEALCHDNSIEMKFLKAGSLVKKTIIVDRNHQKNTILEYSVKIRFPKYDNPIRNIYRDMPLSIMRRFIIEAKIHDPEITFAIILMAYVGLRLGEVCNVRQVESIFGKGIRFQYGRPITLFSNGEYHVKNTCSSIEIDLSETLPLRSDGVSVGGIKRPRMQRVFAGFTEIVYSHYEKHMQLMKNKDIESTRPMFVSRERDKRTGKYLALTKGALYLRIKRLFENHVLPSLATDEDEELQQFYYAMQNHSWGPHAFRHWFTVKLVVEAGVDEVTLQTLRGDKSRESSKTYLERKGELERIYRSSVESLGAELMKKELEDYE